MNISGIEKLGIIGILSINIWSCSDLGSVSSDEDMLPVISYSIQIQPIFDTYCHDCHGISGGLSLASYDDLMRGGEHGQPVIPGNSEESILIQKLSENPPFGERMPNGLPPLEQTLIDTISTWIDNGAENN